MIDAWNTSSRISTLLIENLPDELWAAKIPGYERRTIHSIAAHLHNARCTWVKRLGQEHGIVPPAPVSRSVQRRQLVAAMRRSSEGVVQLLQLGLDHDGVIPPSRGYTWRNLPLDVGHVLAYLVAHEAHHRGQIVMVARQLGVPLPASVTSRLWWWKS